MDKTALTFDLRVELFLEEFIRECEENGLKYNEDRLYEKAYEAVLDEIAVKRELARDEDRDE